MRSFTSTVKFLDTANVSQPLNTRTCTLRSPDTGSVTVNFTSPVGSTRPIDTGTRLLRVVSSSTASWPRRALPTLAVYTTFSPCFTSRGPLTTNELELAVTAGAAFELAAKPVKDRDTIDADTMATRARFGNMLCDSSDSAHRRPTGDHVKDGHMRVLPSCLKAAEFCRFVREKCAVRVNGESALATGPTTRQGVRHGRANEREGA